MNTDRQLDFSIVGTAKGGTTSLSDTIESYTTAKIMSPKDGHGLRFLDETPSFRGPEGSLSNRIFQDAASSYVAQLSDVPSGVRIGDASVFYMYNETALSSLQHFLAPDGKIVVSLRRPDDRAYSAYMHMVRDMRETLGFYEALEAEESRIEENWREIWWYRSLGFYAEPIERLFDLFGRERVRVVLYEDLVNKNGQTLRDTLQFLNIDYADISMKRSNRSGKPRSGMVQKFLANENLIKNMGKKFVPQSVWDPVRSKLQQFNLQPAEGMTLEQRTHLIADFEPNIARVEHLIGRDLSSWRQLPRK